MSDIDPRTLDVFMAILETGSATEAAHRLRMTQPAVTRAIAGLEQRIGLVLFERGRFGMRTTPQGDRFAQEVKRSYAGLARISGAAAAIRQGLLGEISVGALPALMEGLVARAAGAFIRAAPNVRMTMHHFPMEEMVRQILTEQVDIVVTSGPVAEVPGIVVTAFGRRTLMALMPADHRLAGLASVTVRDLDKVEMVMFTVNPNRAIISQAFAAEGVGMRYRIEAVTQRGAARTGLAAGLVALVDNEVAAEALARNANAVAIPFVGARSWEVVAVHRKDRRDDPMISGFIAELTTAFAEPVD